MSEDWEGKATEARESYLKLDRREEKIGFLKRWGKEIPGSLFRPGMGKTAQPVDPDAPPVPPWDSVIEGRRYLVMRRSPNTAGNFEQGQFNVILVDAHGTCEGQEHVSRLWHRYRRPSPYKNSAWGLFAMRCPNALTKEEWGRTFNTRGEAIGWAKANPAPKKAEAEPTPGEY